MEKCQKDLLRALVTQLRQTLLGTWDEAGNSVRGDLDRELERLGVAPDGTLTPLDALSNITAVERRARRIAEAQLAGLPAGERSIARREIVERAGYTWINRLLALRAMEARGLIDETLRTNLAYDGLSEALYVLRQTQPERASGADGGWWAVVENACRAQAEALPGLFDLDDPNAALRPSTPALLNCVALVGGDLAGFIPEESDAAFADPDAIGWAYQFYQQEAKDRTYAKLNAGGKVETRAEIAAVTQLFTEPYMVQWLLQNSLGRTYHELYPDSKLPETWEYYIRPDELQPQRADGEPGPSSLEELTLMDPCMGSGHFEREGFDMLAAMYRERYPAMGAREIADAVLGRHLYGIDIDPRAAQLAALTLYLRAWELVRDERRAQRLLGPGNYRPVALNLATTPTGLTPGALERHLERHPEDRVFEPLLRGVFAALEQAAILGSLLQPGKHLDEALRAFRRKTKGQFGLLPEHESLNRLLEELGRHDSAELKRVLLERIARSFGADAGSSEDVASWLFGREMTEGFRLLDLLDHRYAVVATNPPYMGSAGMKPGLKQYVELNYSTGKRDLYAAFILRCLDLCALSGRVGMITMQGWMFLTSYTAFRAGTEASLSYQTGKTRRTGLFARTSIETLAHLGPHAFEEITGEVVQAVMFTLLCNTPAVNHRIVALRLVTRRSPKEKATSLQRQDTASIAYRPEQSRFSAIPGSPFCYWLDASLLNRLAEGPTLASIFEIKGGLSTTDNQRFVRHWWETDHGNRWLSYTKGGGYARWAGNELFAVDWEFEGSRMKSYIVTIPGNTHWSRRIFNCEYYFRRGYTYSPIASGTLAARSIGDHNLLGHKGPGIFAISPRDIDLAGIFNTRLLTHILRALAPQLGFELNHLLSLPAYEPNEHYESLVTSLAKNCVVLKHRLVALREVADRAYDADVSLGASELPELSAAIEAALATYEAAIDRVTLRAYGLGAQAIDSILSDTGIPPGFYPLLEGYSNKLPHMQGNLDLSDALDLSFDSSRTKMHSIRQLDVKQLKSQLRALFEAGPGSTGTELEKDELDLVDASCEESTGNAAAIPAETFLEELSHKLQVHPISVYWLLDELRAEGIRCKPEEQRILEDRLSILVLCLLGHRWPKQVEAGEPAPDWADPDGIIPLTSGIGETVLAERLRARLRAEEGPLSAQQTEALLRELTGQNLETWLRKAFFLRHVRQFKHRPIAWHLASTPRGRKKASRTPAFECLLYYHTCEGDVLARLRSHYLETLIYAERRQVEHARQTGDETAAAQSTERIHELEDFAVRLRQVEAEGFACPELQNLLQADPLDRWSGDGVFPPGSRDELLANERAWHADINDGVRVNIAPLQEAGLLAANVLNANDLRKAIADRARWRSDERRWVREGVLPRCGWMDESVPESPRWIERAPEREAERQRLEEKRLALTEKLEGTPEALDEAL